MFIQTMSDITESMTERTFSSPFLISAWKSETKLRKIYRNLLIFVEIIFSRLIRTYPIVTCERYDILLFFILRKTRLNLRGEKDQELPLSSPTPLQKIGSKLDLNNADLIGCTVKRENEAAQRRFMVVDVYQDRAIIRDYQSLHKSEYIFLFFSNIESLFQIILVQPDSSRLGWGVVTFSGPLQDLEIEQRCFYYIYSSNVFLANQFN